MVWVGVLLHGPLWTEVQLGGYTFHLRGDWFSLPTLLLGLTGYEGAPAELGYEYGMTYILTACVFSLLLVFDAWDVSRGYKP